MPHPDQHLIESLLQADAAGIRLIYERCAGPVNRLILNHGGQEADAADVFQECLLTLFRSAARGLELTSPIEALVLTICRNKWTDIVRSRIRRGVTNTSEERLLDKNTDSFGDAEQILLHQQRRNVLLKVLDGMGEPCHRLLQLSWEGLGMEDVAAHMSMTYGFARKKKSQCIGKLTELMKQVPEYEQLKY